MRHPFVAVLLVAAVAGCGKKADTETWVPAEIPIQTPWTAEVSPANAHPEYPRPQLVREQWASLNGLWDYAVVPADDPQPKQWDGQILVPFCIESSLSGVGRRVSAEEALWYSTTFTVPRAWKKQRVMLNFEAVDWSTDVYVNDQLVGHHTGGYTAFSYDVTPFLKKRGAQKLVLKVLDATNCGEQPCGKQVTKPNGIWYTPVTGIWQSVWIEPVRSAAVTSYLAVPDIDAGAVDVTVYADGVTEDDRVEIWLREGGLGYSTEEPGETSTVAFASVAPGKPVRLTVADPKLWSPESPFLYEMEIQLKQGKKVVDEVRGYTALRKSSEVVDSQGFKRLGLNNEPYFQYGPLDQGWWPDGLYTAPTDEALKFDLVKTKDFGYNMIRKHIKIEPARWYYWADVLGIVIWQDMPSIGGTPGGHWEQWKWASPSDDRTLTESAKATYFKEWGEIIAQLRNHPSIVAWVPFNESWSQFNTEKVVEFTRSCDPTRLINSASGGNSYPGVGDIFDSHNYPNPQMKFTSGGLQIDVLGEYGGIGWPVEGHLWQADKNWGYIEYKGGEDVLKQYSVYAEDLKKIIQQGVSAAVYTQTTDVEGEVNGLMTYDRKIVKMDESRLRAVNQEVIASMGK
jgi:beta-galactosidase/beta-glucuronidase